MRSLEGAINEQQKIFVKRGNIDVNRNKVGFNLIQLPSEKVAALCVMHLMKHLLSQFVKDTRLYEEEYSMHSEAKEAEFLTRDLKIPAIQLFHELGLLFDKELKNSMAHGGQGRKEQAEW